MSAHDGINAANAEAARVAGWPELTGTPAQIPWAISVRADKMREFDAAVVEESMSDVDRVLFREALLRQTQAGEWIDCRSHPWQALALRWLTADERAALFARGADHP
ncbi:hypothetical protein ACQPZ2_44030 (plasmid) [Nocardia pseudovaccinii]|uniref:hypothetical protein n=1 Tax=Nocardia pseudovaccinii TaxID=189540 RepID=UPI003D8D5483